MNAWRKVNIKQISATKSTAGNSGHRTEGMSNAAPEHASGASLILANQKQIFARKKPNSKVFEHRANGDQGKLKMRSSALSVKGQKQVWEGKGGAFLEWKFHFLKRSAVGFWRQGCIWRYRTEFHCLAVYSDKKKKFNTNLYTVFNRNLAFWRFYYFAIRWRQVTVFIGLYERVTDSRFVRITSSFMIQEWSATTARCSEAHTDCAVWTQFRNGKQTELCLECKLLNINFLVNGI